MIYVIIGSKADIRELREPICPFFALSFSLLDFPKTKIYLGKFWQPWKFLNFSATSALVSYQ